MLVDGRPVGWGVQNPKISHELVNLQRERFQKPTLAFLDNAKKSNFINYLQTKNNEITSNKMDIYHPKMYYLTNKQSEVNQF